VGNQKKIVEMDRSFWLSCATRRFASRDLGGLAGRSLSGELGLGLTRSELGLTTGEGVVGPFVCGQSLLDRRGDERDRAKF
jgi:hypothetical protein